MHRPGRRRSSVSFNYSPCRNKVSTTLLIFPCRLSRKSPEHPELEGTKKEARLQDTGLRPPLQRPSIHRLYHEVFGVSIPCQLLLLWNPLLIATPFQLESHDQNDAGRSIASRVAATERFILVLEGSAGAAAATTEGPGERGSEHHEVPAGSDAGEDQYGVAGDQDALVVEV